MNEPLLEVAINRAVEIGAGDANLCQLPTIGTFPRMELYEPNPVFHPYLLEKFGKIEGLTIHSSAISDFDSPNYPFYSYGMASYLEGVPSFAALSLDDERQQERLSALRISVNVKSIESIDDGKIDYLVLTASGSELRILNKMKSRPVVIRVKYYCHNTKHWSYYNKITEILEKMDYVGRVISSNVYKTYLEFEWINKKYLNNA